MSTAVQKPVLVVCAAQRSGTNVVEETLAQGPTFEKYGEIFLAPKDLRRRKGKSLNYFYYRATQARRKAALTIPTQQNQRALLVSYLNTLCANTAKDAIIVDVKYTSWHHLNDVWHLTGGRPFLVDLIQELQLPVLHLIRRNSFQRACSEMVARHTNRYHVRRTGKGHADVSLAIDADTLERRIRLVDEQIPLFRQFFSGYDRYLELYYEQLFDGDRLHAEVGEKVTSLCGFPIEFDPTLTQRKAIPNLRDFIANLDELQARFAGTEIGRQMEAA